MSQKRIHSLTEALANVATGFLVSMILGAIVYPMYGFRASVSQLGEITAIFTVVSIARSYAWRRTFNWIHVKQLRREGP